MQTFEAAKLRKKWKEENGNRECSHAEIEKEYYYEMATGDYVCLNCGEARWEKAGFRKDS